MNEKVVFISSPLYQKHFPGSYHPERPQRLEAIENCLKSNHFWENLEHIAPQKADEKDLLLAHSNELVHFNLSQRGKSVALDTDTILSEHSIETALHAAGAAIQSVELVLNKGKSKRVFAAVRPPGHHAEYNRSMGFCIFNNVAVAAAFALERKYVSKVLVIDWDVHHGNGTQEIFYRRDDVFYFSIHQSPLYPGTGSVSETGIGRGAGYTLNQPLSSGSDDLVYEKVLLDSLRQIEEVFTPEIVFISAGFDAHKNDPIGGMALSENGFGRMTEIVMDFAEKNCDGKIISLLEGGYDLEGLSNSIYQHLKTMS
jgi:acetoin utilization deacetylase AcuC-like enzyme